MASYTNAILSIASFNCRGFNQIKKQYICNLLGKCNFLFLQEHWLSERQLGILGNIQSGVLYSGISGFDSSEVLAGRPFGGCAILWHSDVLINVTSVETNSNRICAVLVTTESWKLILINVYLPHEGDDIKSDEFVHCLYLVEDIIGKHSDCHAVVGGDFNVDFNRNWNHTKILNSFCDSNELLSACRSNSNIDYTYNFSMERFSILDHFLLSSTLHNTCIDKISVMHDVDNISDHDPIFLKPKLDVKYIGFSSRIFAPRTSWVKATENDLNRFRHTLSDNLKCITTPTSLLLCHDMKCTDACHHKSIAEYATAISKACMLAAGTCIPHTSNRCTDRRVPGWTERVEPLREKSIFWHKLWMECGRPRDGHVADCMRRTRAGYHYAIRQVRKDEELIVKQRIAEALARDPSRDFWTEIKRIRGNKAGLSRIVDGCIDEASISKLFADKYKCLYASVPYDTVEMQNIQDIVDSQLAASDFFDDSYIINYQDVSDAIFKLNAHKNDGNLGISTDHFLHGGSDLHMHIAFLLTSIVVHGSVPSEFVSSTVIPIPKKPNVNATQSDNYRGIALSSCFCKILDNIILAKNADRLSTSDLQFGFKRKSSTHMCTMVLKETLSYYVSNNSCTFCTFLDATKAFDRVNYCKLFHLLIKRGLPASVIRILIVMYTGHCVRVAWAGLASSFFNAVNGVKQGGVLSPILFCIYMDDLLVKLHKSGVGCYIGTAFVGALAYADDIVLLAPSPSAMRKLLSVCESYALDFDISFNAGKSNFILVMPNSNQRLRTQMNNCTFSIGGAPVVKVNSYLHLGHIINNQLNDDDDVMYRRNCFIGQANNVLCYFNKLDMCVRIKLFKNFCSSMYGCELWSTDNVEVFCVAWRKALRRVLNLPYDTHSYLLPLLTDTLPVFEEICRRSAKFILKCFNSSSTLVKYVTRHAIDIARYNSNVGKNALFCCNYFKWQLYDFVNGSVSLNRNSFLTFCLNRLSGCEVDNAGSLYEALLVREGNLFVESFTRDDIELIIDAMSRC
jgi:hypothetical protein